MSCHSLSRGEELEGKGYGESDAHHSVARFDNDDDGTRYGDLYENLSATAANTRAVRHKQAE